MLTYYDLSISLRSLLILGVFLTFCIGIYAPIHLMMSAFLISLENLKQLNILVERTINSD